MKILLLGKNGQVGWELNRSLRPLGKVVALGREDADFSSPETLRAIVRQIKPDVIVNAVAYTAVDRAESEEELAAAINSIAPGILAEESLRIDALLIHYSTDYVFDGTKEGPYIETDEPNPANAYGRTKLAGEQAIVSSGCDYLIFRTSWVYAARGRNFLLTILNLAKERDELSIVSDQFGAPTSARLIADTTAFCLIQILTKKDTGMAFSGVYHLASSGSTSWFGFSESIIRIANEELFLPLKLKNLKAIGASDYPTPAQRPMNSRLALNKLESVFGLEMPDWESFLELSIREIE